jgi:hypothetical protein
MEKNIIFQNKKSIEFQKIQNIHSSYYDARTLIYFLPYMFLIEDDRRPLYVVAIPAKPEDCFNLVEYLAYDNMMGIINKLGYNIIPNLRVNISNLSKIIPESYGIPKSKIRSFNMLTSNDIKLLFPII